MGAQQILNKIQQPKPPLQIGGEKVVVGIKKSDIKKGKSFKEMGGELKKASREDLLDLDKYVSFQ